MLPSQSSHFLVFFFKIFICSFNCPLHHCHVGLLRPPTKWVLDGPRLRPAGLEGRPCKARGLSRAKGPGSCMVHYPFISIYHHLSSFIHGYQFSMCLIMVLILLYLFWTKNLRLRLTFMPGWLQFPCLHSGPPVDPQCVRAPGGTSDGSWPVAAIE